MMYLCLIVYMSIINEQIFKNFVSSDCQKAKLYSRMLVAVLQRCSYVERKIHESANKFEAFDGIRKKLI